MRRRTLLSATLALFWSAIGQGGRIRRLQKNYVLTLHNFHNVQYVADIDIGGQKIPAMFDTGSSGLVVQSTRCGHCSRPTVPYNHDNSSTYQLGGEFARFTYGAGPCDVLKGYESVSVGPLTSRHQEFWEVTTHTVGYWNTATFSAIIGLGPTGGLHDQTLLLSFNIDVFSICLQKGADGYLTWGPIASNSMQSKDYHTVRSIGKKHWSADLANFTLSSQPASLNAPVEFCADGPCAVVIDSGHSLIEMPMDALMKFSDLIQIKPDCSNIHELPTLRFNLDGKPFELPPQAYVVRVTNASGEAERVWNILPTGARNSFEPNTCHPAFIRGGAVWVLGMPFFRHYHTTFDQEKKEMRFAAAGPDCEPKPLGPAGKSSLLAHNSRDFKPAVVDLGSVVLSSFSSGGGPLEL